jgi:hypothetical protein
MAIENSQDCAGDSTSAFNVSTCIGAKGGVFYIDKSPTWKAAPDSGWNGTSTDPTEHDGHVLLGWDTAIFSGNVQVPGTPLAVWSDVEPLNRTAVGLGAESSTLRAFVAAGVLPEFPQQIGIFMASRSELQGSDGEIIFGGYDTARVNGSITWFPIGRRFPGLHCPLQVLLEDVILTNINGSQSLMADAYTKVPACIDMVQNAFSFTPQLYQKWANLTNHLTTQPRDGSPHYTDQTYPGSAEPLIGELTLTLSNDQGSNYTSLIPHYELVSQERGDYQGKYSVINATRAMAAVAASENGILGQPLLGGTFLSQNYLVIDFERGLFGLAPAILGNTQRAVSCPAKVRTSSGGKKNDPGKIVLGVFLGLALLFILLLLLFGFRWRKQRAGRKSEEVGPLSGEGKEVRLALSNGDAENTAHEQNQKTTEQIKPVTEVDSTRNFVEVDGHGHRRESELSAEGLGSPGGTT